MSDNLNYVSSLVMKPIPGFHPYFQSRDPIPIYSQLLLNYHIKEEKQKKFDLNALDFNYGPNSNLDLLDISKIRTEKERISCLTSTPVNLDNSHCTDSSSEIQSLYDDSQFFPIPTFSKDKAFENMIMNEPVHRKKNEKPTARPLCIKLPKEICTKNPVIRKKRPNKPQKSNEIKHSLKTLLTKTSTKPNHHQKDLTTSKNNENPTQVEIGHSAVQPIPLPIIVKTEDEAAIISALLQKSKKSKKSLQKNPNNEKDTKKMHTKDLAKLEKPPILKPQLKHKEETSKLIIMNKSKIKREKPGPKFIKLNYDDKASTTKEKTKKKNRKPIPGWYSKKYGKDKYGKQLKIILKRVDSKIVQEKSENAEKELPDCRPLDTVANQKYSTEKAAPTVTSLFINDQIPFLSSYNDTSSTSVAVPISLWKIADSIPLNFNSQNDNLLNEFISPTMDEPHHNTDLNSVPFSSNTSMTDLKIDEEEFKLDSMLNSKAQSPAINDEDTKVPEECSNIMTSDGALNHNLDNFQKTEEEADFENKLSNEFTAMDSVETHQKLQESSTVPIV